MVISLPSLLNVGALTVLVMFIYSILGWFLFSSVTYSNESKIKVLNIAPGLLEKYGAVHEEVAKKMAEGVRKIVNADFGLATSGIAGPTGGSEDKPVGTVCIGVATAYFSESQQFDRCASFRLYCHRGLGKRHQGCQVGRYEGNRTEKSRFRGPGFVLRRQGNSQPEGIAGGFSCLILKVGDLGKSIIICITHILIALIPLMNINSVEK